MTRKLLTLLSAFVMVGCTAQIDDLIVYTEEVKQRTPVSIEAYPEFTSQEPAQYTVNDLRSPFQRATPLADAQAVVAATPNCPQINLQRRKQPLERYGLDALTMSGVFTSNNKRYALVTANDGSLHRVSVGNYLGLFHGRITQITANEIKVKEMLPDGAGCFKSKVATLSMSPAVGDDNNV